MIYAQSFGVFVAVYSTLISLSIVLNTILSATPQIGLNALALAFTVYVVAKYSKIDFNFFKT